MEWQEEGLERDEPIHQSSAVSYGSSVKALKDVECVLKERRAVAKKQPIPPPPQKRLCIPRHSDGLLSKPSSALINTSQEVFSDCCCPLENRGTFQVKQGPFCQNAKGLKESC